jgi:hypothetical protein
MNENLSYTQEIRLIVDKLKSLKLTDIKDKKVELHIKNPVAADSIDVYSLTVLDNNFSPLKRFAIYGNLFGEDDFELSEFEVFDFTTDKASTFSKYDFNNGLGYEELEELKRTMEPLYAHRHLNL